MKEYLQFYINGEWVDPVEPRTLDVENPATEEPFATISLGSVSGRRQSRCRRKSRIPETFSQTSVEYRADLLDKITAGHSSPYGRHGRSDL